jgi:hypothetical protein
VIFPLLASLRSKQAVEERSTIVSRTSLVHTVVVLALVAAGCGPVGYTAVLLDATQAVEEARQEGAGETAPYEYYFATAHLEKAREEAGRAEYQHAMEQAGTAQEYGVRARDLARRRNRERGR